MDSAIGSDTGTPTRYRVYNPIIVVLDADRYVLPLDLIQKLRGAYGAKITASENELFNLAPKADVIVIPLPKLIGIVQMLRSFSPTSKIIISTTQGHYPDPQLAQGFTADKCQYVDRELVLTLMGPILNKNTIS